MTEVRKTEAYAKWLDGLRDARARARVLIRVERLAAGNPGDVRPVGGDVSELRLHCGPGYRVYFKKQGCSIVLLAGGDKQTQIQDIETAKRLARNLKVDAMTKTATLPYDVAEHLRTPEEMAAYLEACMEQAHGDAAFIAKALGDIARSKGMSQVACDAGLSRESLYKALSGERNPTLSTILRVVGALGLKLRADEDRVQSMSDDQNWTGRVKKLVDDLRQFRARNVFNQWDETDADFDCNNAPEVRRSNLRKYLLARPQPSYVFIGEAPSWRGTRFSGIPMTSERILLRNGSPGAHDVMPCGTGQRTSRPEVEYPRCNAIRGLAETSATKVWGTILDCGLSVTDFVLWNAMPWHPREDRMALSNRSSQTFTCEERQAGRQYMLEVLQGLYPSARSIALGEYGARELLMTEQRALPHPSERRGAFRRELTCLLSSNAAR